MHRAPRLGGLTGERLPLADYRAEFRARQWEISGQDSWKLERRQHFREPGFASWEAFARGDWEESIRLIEDERDFLTEFADRARRQGIRLYRVRVVEQPLDPYLQWELHLLRLRAECGELIRVAHPGAIRDYESAHGTLPELVTLGRSLVYQVLYDDLGTPAGAVRVTDRAQVSAAADLVMRLYETGEDLAPYFERAVAPLPAPATEGAPSR